MKPEMVNNKELEKVTGGTCRKIVVPTDIYTYMLCSNCSCIEKWRGDLRGKTFECPECHMNTFTGRNTTLVQAGE